MRFRVGWGGEWHTHYSFLLEKNFITKCSISQLKHNQPGLLRVCVQLLHIFVYCQYWGTFGTIFNPVVERKQENLKFLCTSDNIGELILFLFLRKNGYTHNQSDYP